MKIQTIFLLFVCYASTVSAQDLIVKTTNEEISARVLEIQKQKVLFREFDNPDSETQSLAKREILVIEYEGGMKQYFQIENGEVYLPPVSDGDMQSASPADMYYQGVADAEMYYHKPGPLWGTFGATAFYPLGGIFTGVITGGIIAAIPPDINPSIVPNPDKFHSSLDYRDGFIREAHKIKLRNTAKGFGLGMAVQALWITVIIAVVNN
ncbi:MAG: hypothetical protein R3D00_00075 [Bacteroidia bacterium]